MAEEKSAPKAVRVPRDHPFEKPKRARWPFTAWKSLKIKKYVPGTQLRSSHAAQLA